MGKACAVCGFLKENPVANKVKEINDRIDVTMRTLSAMEDGSMRATDSFNQLLTELFLTKIHKANIQAFQNVRDDIVEIELHICYAVPPDPNGRPNPPVSSCVGKVRCPYPLPTGDALCSLINDCLNKQLENAESALMLTFAAIRRMEQIAMRGSRKKFDPNAR